MDGFLRLVRSPEGRFGAMIAAALCILGLSEIARGGNRSLYLLLLAGSVTFGFVSLVSPQILRPLNKGWLRFGDILGRIVSPIVLGVIFFGLLTPIALVCRLFGRDELHLRRSERSSYWIARDPSLPIADSFKNPF